MMIPELIKTVRSKLGASQDDLGIAISVANVTISNWEIGKTIPSRSTRERLASYCEKKGIEKELVAAIRKISKETQ